MKAQEAALLVGEERLNHLFNKFGDKLIHNAIEELRKSGSNQMKSFINNKSRSKKTKR